MCLLSNGVVEFSSSNVFCRFFSLVSLRACADHDHRLFFSFLTTLAREMIKDMEDMKGDQFAQCTTIPIVLGLKTTKGIVIVLIMVLMSSIVSLQTAWIQDKDWLMFGYFLIAVQLPAASIILQVMRAKAPKDFHLASTLTKVLMLGGVLSLIVFRFTLQ